MTVKATLVIEMDQNELACRIIEAFMERKRPAGATAAQALVSLRADDRAAAMSAALIAMQYLQECSARASKVQ